MVSNKIKIREMPINEYKDRKIELSEFSMVWNDGLSTELSIFSITEDEVRVNGDDTKRHDVFVFDNPSIDELGGEKCISDFQLVGRILNKHLWSIIGYEHDCYVKDKLFSYCIAPNIYKTRFLIEKIFDSITQVEEETKHE